MNDQEAPRVVTGTFLGFYTFKMPRQLIEKRLGRAPVLVF
jgi:hypothetical protein